MIATAAVVTAVATPVMMCFTWIRDFCCPRPALSKPQIDEAAEDAHKAAQANLQAAEDAHEAAEDAHEAAEDAHALSVVIRNAVTQFGIFCRRRRA
jgi:type II secretory pathway component PulM